MSKYKLLLQILLLQSSLLIFSCKEYEFTSPYDTQNNLAAPTELRLIFHADTAVTLNWQFTFVEEIKYAFEVELSEDGSNYFLIQMIKENVNAVTIPKEFSVGKEYHFRIRASVDDNVSGYSNVVTQAINFDPPANVIAQLPTDTVAVIQWQDNAAIETSYEIFLSIDGGTAFFIKEVPANTTQTEYLSDFFLGITYTFSVRAKNIRQGVSIFSSAVTQLNIMQVTELTVFFPDSTTAILTWSKTTGYARAIIIEQSSDGNNYAISKKVSPDSSISVINSQYEYDSSYYFRIRSETKNNYGTYATAHMVFNYLGIKWIFVQNGPTGNFLMSETEVTFDQYDYFCEQTGRTKPTANFGRGKQPVINVNVADAVAFCNWLSQQTGSSIRLSNENEWEFAAKGGVYTKGFTYSGSHDLNLVGWYTANSGYKTHEVKGKLPNELGLYDMSGNVWELTASKSGSNQVLRGGGWGSYGYNCTVSTRTFISINVKDVDLGFRIIRNP